MCCKVFQRQLRSGTDWLCWEGSWKLPRFRVAVQVGAVAGNQNRGREFEAELSESGCRSASQAASRWSDAATSWKCGARGSRLEGTRQARPRGRPPPALAGCRAHRCQGKIPSQRDSRCRRTSTRIAHLLHSRRTSG